MEFMNTYNFRFKGTSEVDFHLGADFGRDPDKTLYMSPRRYIERIRETYEKIFGEKPPKTYVSSPLVENYHPELHTLDLLDNEGTQQYQRFIRQIQWVVSIGWFDITTIIMNMSSFRVMPRIRYIERVKHIVGYLTKFKHYSIPFRVGQLNHSQLQNECKG